MVVGSFWALEGLSVVSFREDHSGEVSRVGDHPDGLNDPGVGLLDLAIDPVVLLPKHIAIRRLVAADPHHRVNEVRQGRRRLVANEPMTSGSSSLPLSGSP